MAWPSLDEMHMGIDESRSEQPTSKIDFRCARALTRRAASSLPTKLIRCSVDHDSSRPWVARGVHASPDEDHELVQEVEFWSRSAGGPRRESRGPSWCRWTL